MRGLASAGLSWALHAGRVCDVVYGWASGREGPSMPRPTLHDSKTPTHTPQNHTPATTACAPRWPPPPTPLPKSAAMAKPHQQPRQRQRAPAMTARAPSWPRSAQSPWAAPGPGPRTSARWRQTRAATRAGCGPCLHAGGWSRLRELSTRTRRRQAARNLRVQAIMRAAEHAVLIMDHRG